MLEGRAALQGDLGTLKKWADMKLNKDEVLHLEWNNPMKQYRS